MKKLLLVIFLLFPLTMWSDSLAKKEVIKYSDLAINSALSLYAGRVNMDYFDASTAYSVGLLLEEGPGTDVQLGLGYTQPASNFDFTSEVNLESLYVKKDEGILFFVNYNF